MSHRIEDLIKQSQKTWTAETGKPSTMSEEDKKLLSDVSGVALIMHAFAIAISSQEPETHVQVAKHMFNTKQKLDSAFPMSPKGMQVLGRCPVCIVDEREEGTECPHSNLIRCAILLMAALRLYPQPDMDLEQEIASQLKQDTPEAS